VVQQIRILVVDGHSLVRRGLRALLVDESWVEEVVEATTAAEAKQLAVSDRFDVVTVCPTLPDGDGIEATQWIVRVRPQTNVLVLTVVEHDDAQLIRALRAGARGVVFNGGDAETIVDAVRTVARGGVVLGPSAGDTLVSSLRRAPAALPAPFDRLTSREREILARVAAGETNARIARHLGLSEKTVRNQLSMILSKLDLPGRVEAVIAARHAGLVATSDE
jgi:DNA-binding NarL/FixJ family response regulator